MRKIVPAFALSLLACSSSVEVEVQLVNPCNQDATGSMTYLRLEPRGDGIESAALATFEQVGSGVSESLQIPLIPNFQLLATGHAPTFADPASALGLSPIQDLSNAEGTVSLRFPFSLLGKFHRTTAMTEPVTCTGLSEARHGATATLLNNGLVLIVGGVRYEGPAQVFVTTIEFYDPATETFISGPPGTNRAWELPNSQVRRNHTASLLPDGRVLIAGGQRPGQNPNIEEALQSAFILDARDLGSFTPPQNAFQMVLPRTQHQAATLPDGRVVLVGGVTGAVNEAQPESQSFTPGIEYFSVNEQVFRKASNQSGNEVSLQTERAAHSATALASSNTVVVAGGFNRTGPVRSVETVRFSADVVEQVVAAQSILVGPIDHSATLSQDGAVVLSGGYERVDDVRQTRQNSVSTVEMWTADESTASRICLSSLIGKRGDHTTSVMGRWALFAGGRDENGAPRADADVAELRPISEAIATACFEQGTTLEPMDVARADHAAVSLRSSGEVLVVGGVETEPSSLRAGASTRTSEIFSGNVRRLIIDSAMQPE